MVITYSTFKTESGIPARDGRQGIAYAFHFMETPADAGSYSHGFIRKVTCRSLISMRAFSMPGIGLPCRAGKHEKGVRYEV